MFATKCCNPFLLRDWQPIQNHPQHLVKFILWHSDDPALVRNQTAYGHGCGFVADSPCRATINCGAKRKRPVSSLLRLCRTRNYCDRSVQRNFFVRKHNYRPPLPEFWQLRVLRKIAPIELPYFRRGFYAGCNSRRVYGFR